MLAYSVFLVSKTRQNGQCNVIFLPYRYNGVYVKIIKVHFSIIWILGDRVQVQQMLLVLAAGAGIHILPKLFRGNLSN